MNKVLYIEIQRIYKNYISYFAKYQTNFWCIETDLKIVSFTLTTCLRVKFDALLCILKWSYKVCQSNKKHTLNTNVIRIETRNLSKFTGTVAIFFKNFFDFYLFPVQIASTVYFNNRKTSIIIPIANSLV